MAIEALYAVFSGIGTAGITAFIRGNESQLQIEFTGAYETTVEWFEKKYGDQYGGENERFIDFQKVEDEMLKLVFYHFDPDEKTIHDSFQQVPLGVIQKFVKQLRAEMARKTFFDGLFAEIQKYKIQQKMQKDIENIVLVVKLLTQIYNTLQGKSEPEKIIPDPDPIDVLALEEGFRNSYKLDQLDYGHLQTDPGQLQLKLDLMHIYVNLLVKERRYKDLMDLAGVTSFTPLQQKNLNRLFERTDQEKSLYVKTGEGKEFNIETNKKQWL